MRRSGEVEDDEDPRRRTIATVIVLLLNAVAATGTTAAQSGAPPHESRFETVLRKSNVPSSPAVRIAVAGWQRHEVQLRQEDD